jgi:flagellar hook-associated protein 2
MSNVLGTTFSVGNGLSNSGDTNSSLLVEAYKRTRQRELDTIDTRKKTLETRQVFFNSLRTRLESITSRIDEVLATTFTSKFSAKKVTSSDASVVSVTAGSTASEGVNSVRVNRLATNDILISSTKTLANLVDVGGGTEKTFSITVNGLTKNVSVTLQDSDTNEQAFQKIVSAINNTTDIGVSASFVKTTSTLGRMTLSSKNTGTVNSITFSDPDNLLGQFGITAALFTDPQNRTVANASSAGFRNTASSNLDSEIELNGIQITRSSNVINDAITGYTFTLNKQQSPTDQAVTIQAELDVSGVKTALKPLIDSYNEIVSFLRNQNEVLKNEPSIRNVNTRIRSTVSQEITGLGAGKPNRLSDIGMSVSSTGQLSISNDEIFTNALKKSQADVANLFTSSNGFAVKLRESITSFLGTEGIITSRNKSISTQISSLDTNRRNLQSRIDRQADSLRKQYESIQKSYLQSVNQYSTVSNLFTS